MSSISNCFKRFLHNHSHLVDFLSASLIICLCLIILLPKVHESFQGHKQIPGNHSHQLPHPVAEIAGDTNSGGDGLSNSSLPATTTMNTVLAAAAAASIGANSIPNSLGNNNLVIQEPEPIPPPDPDHHHHHHSHKVPVGEVLICVGFFVFYCVGLGISRLNAKEREPLMMAERKVSTVCCSSTRCPSSQQQQETICGGGGTTGANMGVMPAVSQMTYSRSQDNVLESEQLVSDHDRNQQDDCVLLLNRHHNHHTHVRHHEHPHTHPHLPSNPKKRAIINYGSTSRINGLVTDPDHMMQTQDNYSDKIMNPRPNTVHVEEISIIRQIRSANEDDVDPSWPLSIKVTIFGLLLAAFLVIFDLHIHGLMQSIKVFRAAATGALLYLAFFLILPRDSAGCNSCNEEEI